MLQLRVRRSELTYEAQLAPPLSAVIDTPGKLASALISQFDYLVGLADVTLDEGPLQDRGLSCEVEKFHTSILLRADRVEIHFLAVDETWGPWTSEAIHGVWKAIASTSPEVAAKSHSLLFEMDCEPLTGSYQAALERFCSPHRNLPEGTETAVVYYLPQDLSQGFPSSSFVLNRSAEVQGGLLLAMTLVFDSRHSQEDVVQQGRGRLDDLSRRLEIELLKDSKVRA
jgi:hypothetical protein